MKADLHLHSRHSGEAAQWLYRRVGLPASYAEPVALYEKARERGMEFFTLTDHHTLDGCLAVADRPGVFLSVEMTVEFPEDQVPVHLLVWGLSETDFVELQTRRGDLYAYQRCLAERQLAHAVAHPLHRNGAPMQVAHLEKLALLFRHFEGVNGSLDALTSEVARFVFGRLTAEKMEELANRHNLAPTHPEPWRKVLIGGSNDCSGLFIGSACTETAPVADAAAFLDEVRAGRCAPAGVGGTPLTHAHGIYGTLFSFAAEKMGGLDESKLVGKAFSRFMEGENPTEFSFGEKLTFLAQGVLSGKIWEMAKPAHASIWRQFAQTFQDSDLKQVLAEATAGVDRPEERAFITACLFADKLLYRFFTRFVQKLSSGNLIEAVQSVGMLAPVGLALAPYFLAFKQLAPDRAWLGEVSRTLTGELAPPLRNTKRAWFTDTLEDVNGVATTIRRMTAATVANGHDLVVVTSRGQSDLKDIPLVNFPPIGEFELPEYEMQKLSFPPVLKMLDFIQREGFTELIISTPGPVGLTALLAAKLLGLPVAGIYHTDFPQYVRILTEDRWWETLTWAFMRSFYAQMDTVWVNSESCHRRLIEQGIVPERLRLLPRGLDTQLFHPGRRESDFWQKRSAAAGATVLLFVGRISKEKNLELLITAWETLRRPGLALALVGDGPYLAELKQRAPDVIFTGYLLGEELARAYASADLFLFPSTTDTFGNVILEALASGLPCVVSDEGGPRNLIQPGVTGAITRGNDLKDFTATVQKLLAGPLDPLREAAVRSVQDRDWREAAARFWEETARNDE